jgi:formate C-acetyltransferase
MSQSPSDFQGGEWEKSINVRDFIQQNITAYEGDASFLEGPTDRTQELWQQVSELIKEEIEKGILDLDTEIPSTITSHAPGYIDKEKEVIVGLQTDKPLKRAIKSPMEVFV